MAIKRAAGFKCTPCEYTMSPKDGNGGEVVMTSFPMRNSRRVGRQEVTNLRDERGNVIAMPKSVGVATPTA